MSEAGSDYDVMKIDLPAYQEDSFAIPDIEPENSFADNKEEIYRRNRLIVADMQLEHISRLEDAGTEKSSGLAGPLRGIVSALTDNVSIKIAFRILLLIFVIVTVILFSLGFQIIGHRLA